MATFLTSVQKAGGDTVTASNNNDLRKDIAQLAGDIATAGGSSNAYTLTIDSLIAAYTTFQSFKFKANFTNTAAATLNVNSLGAKTIKKLGIGGLVDVNASDLVNGNIYTVVYDGTVMQLQTGISTGDKVAIALTFGEDIDGTSTPQAVYLKASDGKVWRCDSEATESSFAFIGFTKQNITANNIGVVIVQGLIEGFTSLTAGADYFTNATAGAIGTSPGTYSYKIARAMSTTSVMIEKGLKMAMITFDTRTTNGSTATTGVGFRPKEVEFIIKAVFGSGSLKSVVTSKGYATNASNQYNVYDSSGYDDRVSRVAITASKIIKLTANTTGSFTDHVIADLTSLDSDGFTINYTTTNGIAYTVLAICRG